MSGIKSGRQLRLRTHTHLQRRQLLGSRPISLSLFAATNTAGSRQHLEQTALQTSMQTRLLAPWERGASVQPTRTCLLAVSIKDFALVEQQELKFGQGLNAITGESGSGKSVLVEALALLLGATSPPECVRAHADMSVIEGCFWLASGGGAALQQPLKDQGVPARALPPTDRPSELNIRREILIATPGTGSSPPHLRSRCFINGCPVTLRALRALSGLLVDMNGQHSSLALADPGTQIALLDRVASCGGLMAEVSSTLKAMQNVEAKLEELDALSDDYERTLMRKMVDAVKKARIKPGEEMTLKTAVRAMEAQRATAEQCSAARQMMAGDGSTGLAGGLAGGLRALEQQLKGVLAREESVANAAEMRSSGGNRSSSKRSRRSPSAAPQIQQQSPQRLKRQGSVTPSANTMLSAPASGRSANGAGRRMPSVSVDGRDAAKGAVARGAGVEEDMDGELDAVAEEAEAEEKRRAVQRAKEERRGAKVESKEDEQGQHEEGEEEEVEEEDEEEHPLLQATRLLSEIRQQMVVVDEHVRTYSRSIAFSVHEHDNMSERLRMIERLLRMHRCRSSTELLDEAQRAEQKLDAYEDMLANADIWEKQMDDLRERLVNSCCALSAARRAAVPGLVHLVQSALTELAMGDARFDVQVSWTLEPEASQARESEALDISAANAALAGEPRGAGTYRITERGLDSVVLRLAAGPSEPLRPLAAVASGGEAARIMLALKAAPTGGVAGSLSGGSVMGSAMGMGVGGAAGSATGHEGELEVDLHGEQWLAGPAGHKARTDLEPEGGQWGTETVAGFEVERGLGMQSAQWLAGAAAGGDDGSGLGLGLAGLDAATWGCEAASGPGLDKELVGEIDNSIVERHDLGGQHRKHVHGEHSSSESNGTDATSQGQSDGTGKTTHTANGASFQLGQDHDNLHFQHPSQPGLTTSHLGSSASQRVLYPPFSRRHQGQDAVHKVQASTSCSVHGARDFLLQHSEQQPQISQQQSFHLPHPQQPQHGRQQYPPIQPQSSLQQPQHQQPHVPILVLDELDSGVGSRLGASVGHMLRRMAAGSSQVVCVTHLPQVACYADHHIKVLKHLQPPSNGSLRDSDTSSSQRSNRRRGQITTQFAVLSNFEQRVHEIAEMMGMNESVAKDQLLRAWGRQQ